MASLQQLKRLRLGLESVLGQNQRKEVTPEQQQALEEISKAISRIFDEPCDEGSELKAEIMNGFNEAIKKANNVFE